MPCLEKHLSAWRNTPSLPWLVATSSQRWLSSRRAPWHGGGSLCRSFSCPTCPGRVRQRGKGTTLLLAQLTPAEAAPRVSIEFHRHWRSCLDSLKLMRSQKTCGLVKSWVWEEEDPAWSERDDSVPQGRWPLGIVRKSMHATTQPHVTLETT